MRLLCLGDSYTIGEGVDQAESWPYQLSERMHFPAPKVIARTGWTSRELLNEIRRRRLSSPVDVAFVQIGVNDQYRGLPMTEFSESAAEVLEHAAAVAARTIGVSIPDWSVTPYAADRDRAEVATKIDDFNREWSAVCRTAGAGWVDVTGLSRRFAAELTADGLHPDGVQYRRWVDVLVQVFRNPG